MRAEADSSEMSKDVSIPAGESKSWNWHPDLPIQYSPIFSFPPKPSAILRWIASAWLPLTELTCYLLLAIAVWKWVQPSLENTTTVAAGWIVAVWLRNILMMTAIATVLHLWLHSWRMQGDRFRYMRTSPTAAGSKFLGGQQLRDNVFYTLASGVTLWTIYECLMWLAYANGIAPMVTLAGNPVWFVLWFLLIGIWYSFHFCWVHRLLHWQPLYRRFHSCTIVM